MLVDSIILLSEEGEQAARIVQTGDFAVLHIGAFGWRADQGVVGRVTLVKLCLGVVYKDRGWWRSGRVAVCGLEGPGFESRGLTPFQLQIDSKTCGRFCGGVAPSVIQALGAERATKDWSAI